MCAVNHRAILHVGTSRDKARDKVGGEEARQKI